MRIISGKYKGLNLTSVGKGDAAAHLRPTSDRVRESIFNLLQNGGYGNPVHEARVLDLFAGTGALGLEAISRGAVEATFVDDGAKALSLIKQNSALCRAESVAVVLRRNVARLGTCGTSAFDLVFLDPPYGKGLGEQALQSAVSGGWIEKDALIVWEENAAQIAPAGFTLLDSRKYADTFVNLLQFEGTRSDD